MDRNRLRSFAMGFAVGFIAIGLGLWVFAEFVMGKNLFLALPYLSSQGIFKKSVAVTGILGYVIFKIFDKKSALFKAQGALGALIVWFLFLTALYFL